MRQILGFVPRADCVDDRSIHRVATNRPRPNGSLWRRWSSRWATL